MIEGGAIHLYRLLKSERVMREDDFVLQRRIEFTPSFLRLGALVFCYRRRELLIMKVRTITTDQGERDTPRPSSPKRSRANLTLDD